MKKGDEFYVKRKGHDNSFNSQINKKGSLYKLSYYTEPDSHDRNKVKVELDLPNYATTSDIEIVRCVDASKFAKKELVLNLKQMNQMQII